MYVTDNQIGRYLRRIELGYRFLAHGARTQTARQWTGLSRDQLTALRRRYLFSIDGRHRGPSPSSFEPFFASRRRRAHAALFLAICRIVGTTRTEHGPKTIRFTPNLENGERLCEAFEIFREWAPDAEFDFEQVHLLAFGAERADKIELGFCDRCSAVVLFDKLDLTRTICHHCSDRHASVLQHVLPAR